MKIGFLGGTFDPVHWGHLIKAQDALEALGLERVYFVPAAANPLKEEPPVATCSERRALLELALEGEKCFGLLDLELGSTGPSYTVDTVRRLISRFPGDRLFWIIGTDQLKGLQRWRAIEELAGLIEFACLRRPGHAFEDAGIAGLRLHPIEGHVVEIMKRVQNGDIGEIVSAQCYWIMGALWVEKAKNNLIDKEKLGWSDMEYQCRNWLFFTWLSGDHIVEQHVHNMDVVNWAMGTHPVKAMGMGGREVRTEPQYGNVFDHFAVEYEYPNGARVLSMCRQTEGASSRVSERLVGTMGSTYTSSTKGYTEGKNAFLYEEESPNPYLQEHTDLIASIRKGEPLNEGKQVAESTLTAIMGRMSAYTGRELKWDWVMNASKLDLSPQKYEFGELPMQTVPVPGKTMLI